MNWLLARLARLLLGPAVSGVSDELMDRVAQAIREEGERTLAQEA